MRSIGLAVGILILTLVLLDVAKTTLGQGGGPLTRRLGTVCWQLALRAHRRTGGHGALVVTGVGIVLGTLVLWSLLLWAAWTLVFGGGAAAVVDARTGATADFWQRAYFAGFTIFTLGVGDFVAQGTSWQVLTPVATFTGLFVVTLGITYVTPVSQAATQRRQLAVYVTGLGRSAEHILIDTWRDGSLEDLGKHLATLAPQLALLEQRHLSYPVLHYLHGHNDSESAALALARLDEALSLILLAVRADSAPDPTTTRLVRRMLDRLLATLQTAYIAPAREAPPLPDVRLLRTHGLPLASDAEILAAFGGIAERRRLLLGLVRNDGWSWDDLRPSERG